MNDGMEYSNLNLNEGAALKMSKKEKKFLKK